MPSSPPEFEKKPNCYKCGASFGLITRQHHCRNCGKSVCDKCSTKTVPLPHFGIGDHVRVCDPCYSSITNPPPKPKAPAPAAASSSSSQSDHSDEYKSKKVAVCKCGLPMCVCPPDPEPKSSSSASVTEKKAAAPRPAPSSTPLGGFGFGQFSSASNARQWDLKGDLNEQCREALKYGDDKGAQMLLDAGANANYVDRTGSSLLHLAAMFNRQELAMELLKKGANPNVKNATGETPLDLAPPALSYKLKNFTP